MSYRCGICKFDIDLYCARYPPPEVIETSKTHPHTLTLLKERIKFHCAAACGKIAYGFPYKCHEYNVAFHLDCIWQPSEVKHALEVNHFYHSSHPLKLFMGFPPNYSDGKCRLCGRKVDELFYHCSSCNFTLDMRCIFNPPRLSVLDLKDHDHLLVLRPRLDYFTCNVCGLNGDRSPYICLQCDFMIHQDCLGLPRVININRHVHRVSRTSLIGVVYSVCGVCRQKVDWIYGGYSCQRCSGYVVHSKCATKKDVWNGKELEGVPEETKNMEPYVVIDDKTIQHFSHEEHYLRLNVNDTLCDENKRCNACTHPICLQSFYGCMNCDFLLHQNCAQLPTRKFHVLHNDELTLATSQADIFHCQACSIMSNGFMYEDNDTKLDVRCGSVSEPFVHPSHPHHPLYYIPRNRDEICNGCNENQFYMLRCIEDDYILCFKCASLPKMVKHRVDDNPLSLSYDKEANGTYWCDICEEKTNPDKWFYTCKDHRASLHTECVLGDTTGLMPRSTVKYCHVSYEVVVNNSVTRPFCWRCESRCLYPIILKMLGTSSDAYFCSTKCVYDFSHSKNGGNLIKEQV